MARWKLWYGPSSRRPHKLAKMWRALPMYKDKYVRVRRTGYKRLSWGIFIKDKGK